MDKRQQRAEKVGGGGGGGIWRPRATCCSGTQPLSYILTLYSSTDAAPGLEQTRIQNMASLPYFHCLGYFFYHGLSLLCVGPLFGELMESRETSGSWTWAHTVIIITEPEACCWLVA